MEGLRKICPVAFTVCVQRFFLIHLYCALTMTCIRKKKSDIKERGLLARIRNLQPTRVLQCLADKRIKICASGSELGVKMGPCHVRWTKTIV